MGSYAEHALSQKQCQEWFRKFKSVNFDLRNKERGRLPKKFEDSGLQALLDEDDIQTLKRFAEQLNVSQASIPLRLKVRKMGATWMNEGQQENENPLKKFFLKDTKESVSPHRIVTVDEKCT